MLAAMKAAPTLLGDQDLYLFNEGSHFCLYDHLGAHPMTHDGVAGTYFAVWAPAARRVAVIRDGNVWKPNADPLRQRGHSGLWEGFLPHVGMGDAYKYQIESTQNGYRVAKADPLAFFQETPPK